MKLGRLTERVLRSPTKAREAAVVARSGMTANLARHKVPRDVTFVDDPPRNVTGKLLRNRLG